MRTLLLAMTLVVSGCGPVCPLNLCRTMLTVQLSAAQRAVFDEGEAAVQLCIDAACDDFTLPAGTRFADSGEVYLNIEGSQLKFSSRLLGEGPRDVKLVVTREGTERLNRTWSATPFSFIHDQSNACAQTCVQTTVSAE